MKCPYCGEIDSKVIDSRPADDGERIRRRRECLVCQKRFTTYEIVETKAPVGYTGEGIVSHVVEIQQSELLEKAQKIVELNMGMIEALSAAIEFRNGESGEHVHRIHDITEFLLTNTPLGEGLTPDEIGQISLAAIMHDVGKIAIPDAILNKPGKLTPEEFEIMKTHTIQGAHLLEKIPPAAGERVLPLRLRHRPPPP